MSSRVYFRFSSSTDFDFVSFDGSFITIRELKYLISKKTGVDKDRNTVIELFDSRTGEEYVDMSAMVAKNASVVAKRSPVVRPPPISASTMKTPTAATKIATPPTKDAPRVEEANPKAEENMDDGLGPGVFAPDTTEEAPDDDAAISELVKGFWEVWSSDLNMPAPWKRGRGREIVGRARRGPMRMGRANLPPMGYVCHRCNTPGHFIDECPTNGDPAYDFVRVRYPTGIPSSMLEKDDQGGLLMPNGERARLKPNMEKFKREMECVPVGEPSVKQLMGSGMGEALTEQGFDELAAMMGRNPLMTLTPLMMNTLPRARPVDIRRGFFGGAPFDRQTFQQCREEHDRARAAYEGTPPPTHLPPVWNRAAPPPSNPPSFDSAPWRHPPPTEMFPDRHWQQKGSAYTGYAPPEKSGYFEQHPPWHPRMPPPFYSPGFPQPPPFPPEQRYDAETEQTTALAPPAVETTTPALPSKVVRLHEPLAEEQHPESSEGSRRSKEAAPEPEKSLPYGFERSLQNKTADEVNVETTTAAPPTAQRHARVHSESLDRSHRRKLEHRTSSDRSSPSKRSKVHKKNGRDKPHHRTRDRERRRSQRENVDRPTPPAVEIATRRHDRIVENDGLDRWELDNAMHEDDDYLMAEMEDSRFKHKSSERQRSSRSRSERTRRLKPEQGLS